MIDIGSNLGHQSFIDDLPLVIDSARDAGISHIVVTGTSVDASEQALELTRHYPDFLTATAGVHPHDASEFSEKSIVALRELAAHPANVAIGETGLDYHRNYSPQEAQKRAFAAQLELAMETGKPVFMHQRDAHEHFMEILKPRLGALTRGVVHCFTGNQNELEKYLEQDLYIGITGWICDERRGHHLHDMLHLIPDDRLLIETDSPYLLPRTIRPKPSSRRNEPANLGWVAQTIADCLGRDVAEVKQQTAKNARKFFNLPE